MPNPFIVIINQQVLSDIKSFRLVYSIDRLARNLTLQLSDKWINTRGFPLPFQEGDAIELLLSGQVRQTIGDTCMFKGFIDEIPMSWSMTSHAIGLVASSAQADLVDSSATHATGSWRNVTLDSLALDLTSKFDIGVVVDLTAVDIIKLPFDRWAIEDEETVFECLKRAAKMRGVFLVGDEGENIIITRASKEPQVGALALGINVESGARSSNYRDRHDVYTVKSQRAGSDTEFSEVVGQGVFQTKDAEITRHRPLIMVSDGQGKIADLERRANWERNTRAGKSRGLTYKVSTIWNTQSPTKEPWLINRLISVVDSVLDFTGYLLVSEVDISYGPMPSSGSTVNLKLISPEAFNTLIPPKPRVKGSGPLW